MLTTYPEFSRLELSHYEVISKLTSKYPPYSDFNFISLYSWDTDRSTSVSIMNNNLVIRLPDYITSEPVTSVLGNTNIDDTLQELLRSYGALKLVPETVIKSIEQSKLFIIEEDRDNHDYIYDLSQTVNLVGSKYKKIRNKLSALKRFGYEKIDVQNLTKIDNTVSQELITLFDAWAKTAKQSLEDSAAERIAIRRLLDGASELNLLFTTVRIDSELVAFSINEILEASEFSVCHFEKAISIHEHMPTFVAHEAVKALFERGVKYANWEQDMGLAGLREAKSKWQPSSLLKKYKVSLA